MKSFKEKGRFEITLGIKESVAEKPVKIVPPAEIMSVYLKQHLGVPTQPQVQIGDSVKFGQILGDLEENQKVYAAVHSPVNGKVIDITTQKNPFSNKVEQIIKIQTEDAKTNQVFEKLNPETASKEDLLNRVKKAGIVGLGGATYPTHLKLGTPNRITNLIINAKESDPNTSSDYRLMVEKPDEVLKGIQVMAKILNVHDIIVATRTKEGMTPHLDAILQEHGIRVVRMRPNYSIGSEKLLIKEILGYEVPQGHYPPEIGIVVHNIATVYAVYEAVYEGLPLVSRGITFYSEQTGGENLWVRIGTPIEHIFNFLNISPTIFEKTIMGSIFMGPSLESLNIPIEKGTTAITGFSKDRSKPYADEIPCIRCNYCNIVCPVDIYPQLIMEATKKENVTLLKKLHVEVCIDCGLCSYVCPSLIKFTPYLLKGKKLIKT
ncbi:MAG: RnfABCDGE type electron transport complex subunit C [Candidatus Lokiarchaeota archaeon]|nr:RnfABCDGE type electron transport complex subunit C [Candidatus Lokiarchaeota archaeon]